MGWRNKARFAKAVAKLPPGISYGAYYLIQRHFGTLRQMNPIRCLKAGVAIVDLIRKRKPEVTGSETFLEVGTGRCLSLPMALWLCGAFRTITVDLNPYLKAELVFEEIAYIRNHQDEVTTLFGPHSQKPVFRERFDLLLRSGLDLDRLLSLMNIEYHGSANAAQLELLDQSIDYHVSFMVLQHIRPAALAAILREARRLLKPGGLSVHYVVLGDLFSGFDHSISQVNFLQFSEEEWESIAGNRYMYHNRLRADELRGLFEGAGLAVRDLDAKIDPVSLRALKANELPLDQRFRGKTPETNATATVWVTASPSASCSATSGESVAAIL
jgi:SAM-dependent methyltransferase